MAYFPNFQPYPYQDQLNQLRTANPMTMQMQGFPPMQARPEPGGLNWVQGEAGAKSWYITPGSTVLLMDSEAQRFYLKSADMNGLPAMRTFEYNEVGAAKPQEAPQAVNFVSTEEFNGFRDEVLKKLEELSAPVEVSLSRKKKGVNADE